MGNARIRTKGKVEELTGKAKTGVGKLIGNEQMQLEGKAKALKGKAAQGIAKARGRAKGAVDEVTTRVKKRLG